MDNYKAKFLKRKNYTRNYILGGATVLLLFIFCLSQLQAAGLSKSVFPQELEGFPLIEVEEIEIEDWEKEYGVEKCYIAYYFDEYGEKDGEIDVDIVYLKSAKKTKTYMEDWIPLAKEAYKEIRDARCESTKSTKVGDYSAKYFRSTTGSDYTEYYFKNGIDLMVPVSNYLINITVSQDKGTPSLDVAKRVARIFVDKLEPSEGFCGDGSCGEGESYSNCPEDCEKPEPVCGNKNCEEWVGEDCKNCSKDCHVSDSCCEVGSFFMYVHDYQDKRYRLHESYGGTIFEGTLVVPSGTNQSTFFKDYTPKLCKNGKIISGECLENWHCSKGVCKSNKCVETVSTEVKEVTDKEVAKKIQEEQSDYKIGYAQTYTQIKDNITTAKQEPGLDIRLEVQGSTASKLPEVNVGDEIVVRLEIENISNHSIAVTAGIVYPAADFGGFQLEEKDYTMSFGWSYQGVLNWGSLIGSFKTKLIGGKYIVMPKTSKLHILSKVVPKEEGYLDAQGMIYYTSEDRFVKPTKNLVKYMSFSGEDVFIVETGYGKRAPEEFEKTFDETEVSKSILIKEKKCGWPFCIW